MAAFRGGTRRAATRLEPLEHRQKLRSRVARIAWEADSDLNYPVITLPIRRSASFATVADHPAKSNKNALAWFSLATSEAATRGPLLENCPGADRELSGEDTVDGAPRLRHEQRVPARPHNRESSVRTTVTNDAASFWFLGLDTEDRQASIHAMHCGSIELLGRRFQPAGHIVPIGCPLMIIDRARLIPSPRERRHRHRSRRSIRLSFNSIARSKNVHAC